MQNNRFAVRKVGPHCAVNSVSCKTIAFLSAISCKTIAESSIDLLRFPKMKLCCYWQTTQLPSSWRRWQSRAEGDQVYQSTTRSTTTTTTTTITTTSLLVFYYYYYYYYYDYSVSLPFCLYVPLISSSHMADTTTTRTTTTTTTTTTTATTCPQCLFQAKNHLFPLVILVLNQHPRAAGPNQLSHIKRNHSCHGATTTTAMERIETISK